VMQRDEDAEIRAAAMAYLDSLGGEGSVFTSKQLQAFTFQGRRIPLIVQAGIRTVRGFDTALTIRTAYSRNPADAPYQDVQGEDGYMRYKWRGTDPNLADNRCGRAAMERGLPLIWFVGVNSGLYLAIYPVWLVSEEPDQQQWVVALNQELRHQWSLPLTHPMDRHLRADYAIRESRVRLHQRIFRQHVLTAYGAQCALCRLRHPELLDAAHIKEDADGGKPIVPNGVAMCAIHHRAFDSNVLGITPAYEVRVRPDVLEEVDGPTLRFALQGLHRKDLILPRSRSARPDRELLEERYERFKAAS
jgi:putative restriction endonuclease